MPVFEKTVVQCDYCDAEATLHGAGQLNTLADLMSVTVVPGTHLRIPKGWQFVHGKYACPKHEVIVTELVRVFYGPLERAQEPIANEREAKTEDVTDCDFKEPWRVVGRDPWGGKMLAVKTVDDRMIHDGKYGGSGRVMERIVACVNAYAGIPTGAIQQPTASEINIRLRYHACGTIA